jgi:hypothetical protein
MLKPRNETVQALFPAAAASYVVAEWVDTLGYDALGPDALLFETTIDLSGWSMNEFTFGTVQTQYQDPGVYSTTAASAKAEVVEIISDVPISNADLQTVAGNLGTNVPGMMGSKQDFATILYGNYRLYVPNASLTAFPGFLQLISSGSFGSKEPTASDRLYCYRIVKCFGAPGETLAVPACRVGLFGSMYQEGDIEYMMRLKRSYELQQLQS